MEGLTIDSAAARDLDDAVWVERDGGLWRVRVAVADVAGAVAPDTPEDARAAERLWTRYWPGGSEPMLPRQMAEDTLSLLPGQARGVVALELVLEPWLELAEAPRVRLGSLQSRTRLTHAEVARALEQSHHPLRGPLGDMATLAEALQEVRRDSGGLGLDALGEGWWSDEEGHLIHLDPGATVGYVIVQELMILANAHWARWLEVRKIPALFRNHAVVDEAEERGALLARLDLARQEGEDDPGQPTQGFERALGRATYGRRPQGHDGLGLPAYTHLTSPLRRYADLINQRQLRAVAMGLPPLYDEAAIDALAERINEAAEAIRDLRHDFYRARANSEAAAELAHGGPLQELSDRRFERVLKVALRGEGMTGALEAAALARLEGDQAPALELFLVLLASGSLPDWAALRQAALDALVRRPHEAPSVVGVAGSILGWGAPEFDWEASGPQNAQIFEVRARIDAPAGPIDGPPARDSTLKGARHRAMVSALAVAAGLEPPQARWALVPLEDAARPPSPEVADPVSALQRHCQAARTPSPLYHYEEGAPQSFTCVCRALGLEATGQGLGKRRAKREAAAALLRALAAVGNNGASERLA